MSSLLPKFIHTKTNRMRLKHLLLGSVLITQQLSAQTLYPSQRVAGGNQDDYVNSIIHTQDGGYLAGGYSYSAVSGNKTAPGYGGTDYWIVKYNKRGGKQWDKAYGGSHDDGLTTILQTTDGGYLLGGVSFSDASGAKLENNRGNGDIWVIKTDQDGNIQWQKTYGGSDNDHLAHAITTSDGGYIICGNSYSGISGEKTQPSFGSSDYWIIKIDAGGTIQWQQTLGGSYYETATNIAQTNDGGYLVGGSSTTLIGGNKQSVNHGPSELGEALDDIWIVKLNSNGNILWDKSIGGDAIDNLKSWSATPDGGVILGASSHSNKSGNKTDNRIGTSDYWILKMDENANIQWQKTIGSGGYDDVSSIITTSDGGCLVGGHTESGASGNKTEASRGGLDNWMVKLSATGNIEWDKTLGGSGYDNMPILLEVEPNGYLVGSTSNSPASGDKLTASKAGSGDMWFAGIQYTPLANTRKSAVVSPPATNVFTVAPNPVKEVMHIQVSGNTTVSLFNAAGKLVATKRMSGKGEMMISHLPAGIYHLRNTHTGAVIQVMIVK